MKTRQRGLSRKCDDMVRRISQQTQAFPEPHQESDYWHLHLPVARGLLDSTRTPFGVRRLCVQTLINRAQHLAAIAPTSETFARIVVAVSLPELWQSQIIVFFGSNSFDTFFNRNTNEQRWTPLESKRSLAREWNLQLPDNFSERGYHEEIREADCKFNGEMWFISHLTE